MNWHSQRSMGFTLILANVHLHLAVMHLWTRLRKAVPKGPIPLKMTGAHQKSLPPSRQLFPPSDSARSSITNLRLIFCVASAWIAGGLNSNCCYIAILFSTFKFYSKIWEKNVAASSRI